MSKEMMIIFVYDTMCCQHEADDPVSAVLYFHPSWVSDTQKLSLCGQLMGTSYFLRENFASPKLISLQSGKFAIKNFDRFVLAIGTDRNIPESILEYRADLLTNLLKLYHKDISTISDQFTANGQYKNLSEKLYHIFETFLPILQYNGNIFQNVPILKLPKSASNVYLNAIQILQSCQQTKGVLGGAILYHNKTIASQLPANLTKILITSDSYRLKSTVDQINVDFHIPVGVQLLNIYISLAEYNLLIRDAQKARTILCAANNNNNNNNILSYAVNNKKKIMSSSKDHGGMKRDKSIIFTHIPEEESNHEESENKYQPLPAMATCMKKLIRPNHLPLRFKNVTARDLPESGFSSINFDENDSFPDFIGKTSVCSTPMTENKLLQGGNLMSICANIIEVKGSEEFKEEDEKETAENSPEKPPPKTPTAVDDEEFHASFSNFITNPHKLDMRRKSWTNLSNTFKKLTQFSVKPFNFGVQMGEIIDNSEIVDNKLLDDYEDALIDDDDEKVQQHYSTITDPSYPIFNSNGMPLSKYSFQDFLEYHYSDLSENLRNSKVDKDKLLMFNQFDDFDFIVREEFPEVVQKSPPPADLTTPAAPVPIDPPIATTTNNIRKSLTLPIKSLVLDSEGDNKIQAQSTKASTMFDSPATRKKLGGIQLTPLMTKLTILAMSEDKSSCGFSSWGDPSGGGTPCIPELPDIQSKFRRQHSNKSDDSLDEMNESEKQLVKPVEIFICGQQNMTMLLIMELGSAARQELIQTMWETCVSRLTRIESNLHQVLNINVENCDKGEGAYSFIHFDSKWDIVNRSGPWSVEDTLALELMHNKLKQNKQFTEMILRKNENVIYGYQCGESEIFYQQSAVSQMGLPPPADTMGIVPLCAKRRLERDHSIVLL